MVEMLFRDDAYLRDCATVVTGHEDGAIQVDRTVFYPLSGGQPGDTGRVSWEGHQINVVDTRYATDKNINHHLPEGSSLPPVGTPVQLQLEWDRRYIHMRMHTAMHLLGSLLPYGVTGGNISAAKSRLDFDTHEAIDKVDVTERLLALVAEDHSISCRWITDAELAAQPELVRTMSVKPPVGSGQVRLLEIEGVDLQPCGGTHLRQTSEVGAVRISKIENKGKHNRRVNLLLDS